MGSIKSLIVCLFISLLTTFCQTSVPTGSNTQFNTQIKLPQFHNQSTFSDDLSPLGYHDLLNRPGKIIPSCESFLTEFSKQAADFIQCSVSFARPFRFCERCASHYMKATKVYDDIVQNDKTLDDCRGVLLISDRVQIINTVMSSITDIWTRADCNKCFAVLSEDNNGTVTENLTAHTKQFIALYTNFTNCIPENITMERKSKVYNSTVCKDCEHYYDSMNDLFNKMRVREDSPQPVCMDIVDMMNYTRLMWGETLHCTVTHRDVIPVVIITCVLLFIPVGFYVGLAVYGTKKQRKVIREKRLSKFSHSNSYGSIGNTAHLSRSYDLSASTSNHEFHVNSLSESNHIQERPNSRIMQSNHVQ